NDPPARSLVSITLGKTHATGRIVVLLRFLDGISRPATGCAQVLHAAGSAAVEVVSAAEDTRTRTRAPAVLRCRSRCKGIRHDGEIGAAGQPRPGDAGTFADR